MIPIDSIDDPRIAHYRCLKDRELARDGQRFVAEGDYIVRRLLASDYPCESILAIERHAREMAVLAAPETTIYVAGGDLLRQIIGFKFHSGVMAIGRRKSDQTLPNAGILGLKAATLVICPDLISVLNIGSLIRISAALGVDAMLLGESCCDPFWRQSVRTSMGTIFSLPIIRSANLQADLAMLKREGFDLVATVLDENAEPLERSARGRKIALLFGNESNGLDEQSLAACERTVTIPMRAGIDSLNVSIAAGIFLYHFTRRPPAIG